MYEALRYTGQSKCGGCARIEKTLRTSTKAQVKLVLSEDHQTTDLKRRTCWKQ